jgi:serine O-acetyltransferase
MKTKELLDKDWSRLCQITNIEITHRKFTHLFHPRFAYIVLIRWAHHFHSKNLSILAKLISLFNFVIFGLEVPPALKIGPGFVIPHPQGIILGAAEIGSNVTIFHQVTFGAKTMDFSFDLSQRPKVEDNVVVFAGAKVLGPVVLHVGATVAANAVVIFDVPPRVIVGGIPAKILNENI